ncbi:hypothetical protein C7S15_7299 [Burkholderia cepacia]|nr:hypothetical protein [Burkholderia cepacia]
MAARDANVLWRLVHPRLSRTDAARDHRHTRRPARAVPTKRQPGRRSC